MVKIVSGVIEGYGLYEIKDTLKYYGCTWDMDSKKWSAPINSDMSHKIKLFFDKLNKQKSDESDEYWKEACEKCGYKFVKKGTSEYNEVKEEMTRLIRLDKKLKKDDCDETKQSLGSLN